MMINTRIALNPSKENKTTSFHEQKCLYSTRNVNDIQLYPVAYTYIHRTSKRNELKWFFFSLKEGQNRTIITTTAAEATATAATTKTKQIYENNDQSANILFQNLNQLNQNSNNWLNQLVSIFQNSLSKRNYNFK